MTMLMKNSSCGTWDSSFLIPPFSGLLFFSLHRWVFTVAHGRSWTCILFCSLLFLSSLMLIVTPMARRASHPHSETEYSPASCSRSPIVPLRRDQLLLSSPLSSPPVSSCSGPPLNKWPHHQLWLLENLSSTIANDPTTKIVFKFVISALWPAWSLSSLIWENAIIFSTRFSASCLFPLSQLNDCHQNCWSTNHGAVYFWSLWLCEGRSLTSLTWMRLSQHGSQKSVQPPLYQPFYPHHPKSQTLTSNPPSLRVSFTPTESTLIR